MSPLFPEDLPAKPPWRTHALAAGRKFHRRSASDSRKHVFRRGEAHPSFPRSLSIARNKAAFVSAARSAGRTLARLAQKRALDVTGFCGVSHFQRRN